MIHWKNKRGMLRLRIGQTRKEGPMTSLTSLFVFLKNPFELKRLSCFYICTLNKIEELLVVGLLLKEALYIVSLLKHKKVTNIKK